MILTLLMSCSDAEIKVNVKNLSGANIDSIVIEGLGELTIKNIKVDSVKKGAINLANNQSTTDGLITLKSFGKNINFQKQTLDYYSNGCPLIYHYNVTIFKDSISIGRENLQWPAYNSSQAQCLYLSSF